MSIYINEWNCLCICMHHHRRHQSCKPRWGGRGTTFMWGIFCRKAWQTLSLSKLDHSWDPPTWWLTLVVNTRPLQFFFKKAINPVVLCYNNPWSGLANQLEWVPRTWCLQPECERFREWVKTKYTHQFKKNKQQCMNITCILEHICSWVYQNIYTISVINKWLWARLTFVNTVSPMNADNPNIFFISFFPIEHHKIKMDIISYYLSTNSTGLKLCNQKYYCNTSVTQNKIS